MCIAFTKLHVFLEVQQHIEKEGELSISIAKAILYGPPGVGKTTLMKRLIGEMLRINILQVQELILLLLFQFTKALNVSKCLLMNGNVMI